MSEEQLIAANARFYLAFDRRDVAAMSGLWADDLPVSCAHPGWEPLHGRDQVLSSWLAILANPAAPRVRCENPRVYLFGETGYVLCRERLDQGLLAATNVFVRRPEGWRLVHHHAGPCAEAAPAPRPSGGSALN